MRIISKFNDYYDGVQSIGYDPDLCYVRNNDDPIKGDFFDSNLLHHEIQFGYLGDYPKIFFDFYIIGFCGEFYPLLKIKKEYIEPNKKDEEYFCYNIEDVDKSVKKIKYKKFSEFYFKNKKTKGRRKRFPFLETSIFNKKNLKIFFSKEFRDDPYILNSRSFFNIKKNKKPKDFNYLKSLFFEHKVPIFIIYNVYSNKASNDGQYLKLNPCLKDYNFQKAKDPYTAYQEIAQYISGVIGVNTPETVDISDEDKLWEKGFDNWSFKKTPTKINLQNNKKLLK